MNLYDISTDLRRVIEGGIIIDEETGEVIFDGDNLEALECEFRDKLEACALYVKNLRAEEKAIKAEVDNLTARRSALIKKADSMEAYMVAAMQRTDTRKMETPRASVALRKSGRVIITDESALPAEYVKRVEEVKPDKTAIRKALKAGDVPGAHLEEFDNLTLK